MEHTCRLCTITDTTLASISNFRLLDMDQESTTPLDELIEQYLAISVNPSPFDPLICAACLKRLEEWHTFRESCRQHNRLFLEQTIPFEEGTHCVTAYEITFQDQEVSVEEKDNVEFKEEQVEEHVVIDEIHLHSEPAELIIVPDGQSTSSATVKKLSDEERSGKEVYTAAVGKRKRGRPKKAKESTERKASSQQLGQQKRRQRSLAKICTICGVSRTDMAAHMRWHNNERPYQCPHCPKIFLNSSNLKNHINLHTRDKMYKCDLCDKEFPSTTGRSKHRETHATERVHLCAVCGKSFKYRASLARHRQIHFEEPKHKCTVCDRLFLTKTRLMKHFLVHKSDKPFSCDVCGKAFNRKDNLKTHKKTHAFGRRHLKKKLEECVQTELPANGSAR
ncbi:zinc finger protein 501-like [Anopheles maculipalpis]|uniref:zinc finger protein 501-like n=1 Tax=Anopheles maculipalpis TaxID=1496333 RepID=UPI002158DA0D|nr:zinc finger protein 501-like [Anopheles maculipalpis]